MYNKGEPYQFSGTLVQKGKTMSIIYDKLFKLMDEKKISMYRLRQEKAIGQSTYYKLKEGTGNIDTRTINKLCKILDCQPGDILEYVPDDN